MALLAIRPPSILGSCVQKPRPLNCYRYGLSNSILPRKRPCYHRRKLFVVSFSSNVAETQKKKNLYPWEIEEEELQPEPAEKSSPKNPQQKFRPTDTRNTARPNPNLPTAPWMRTWNKQQPTKEVRKTILPAVDYSLWDSGSEEEKEGTALAKKFENVSEDQKLQQEEAPREKEMMQRIMDKLRNAGLLDDTPQEESEPQPEPGSVEAIFKPEPGFLPNGRGGLEPESSWSAPYRINDRAFPWKPKSGVVYGMEDERPKLILKEPTLAEQHIPAPELKRLQRLGMKSKERIKLKSPGINKLFLDRVHEKWKRSEIVKIKCEGSPAQDMKRTHQLLERRTKGFVVWRSGGSIILYRGLNYQPPQPKPAVPTTESQSTLTSTDRVAAQANNQEDSLSVHDLFYQNNRSGNFDEYEKKVDEILEGLGPRYSYWCGRGPLPVDADLLPTVVPGYKTPYRLLPYGVRPKLSNTEMTKLRRLARTVPPHFVLGRNRNHQGLADAMVKLWEKTVVAKIAVKRGVQNTNNELMGEELKRLTGGVLLSRNKEFIVFYRGKDFLTPSVAATLIERETLARALQEEEEKTRNEANIVAPVNTESSESTTGIAGTLGESLEANTRWARYIDNEEREKLRLEAAKIKKADLIARLEKKLYRARGKIVKAERELAAVEALLIPENPTEDNETITDEERHMFRRLGLRMKAFLLLGRRGIFGGTVENMHLHWKYRELTKILSKEKSLEEVRATALMLESQSGGILVSVDKTSKGYAIVVYRGKNYKRPGVIKPRNLLTKREAYKRSVEIQRRKSLEAYIEAVKLNILHLQNDLRRYEDVDNEGIESLNAEMDDTYPSRETEDDDETSDDELLEPYNAKKDEPKDTNIVTNQETDFQEYQSSLSDYSLMDENVDMQLN